MPDRLKIRIAAAVLSVCCASAASAREDLELRMIRIAHGDGASICATAQAALSPDGRMSYDARTSTLVVVDRPEYLPHIEELVASLDVKVPMVRMAVRLTEVTDEFIREAGIHSAQVIFPRGTFAAVLRLLNPGAGAFTRSEMSLTTASGSPAQLQVSREALYGVAAAEYPDASVTYVERRSVGDFLEVLPMANYDNTVTVKIMPRRSSVQGDGTISESAVLTQVTLHGGDTLAIAGIRQERGQDPSARSRRTTILFLTADIIYP